MPLPVLHTPRLVLTPFAEQDVDALHRLWTEPDVRRYLWDDVIITRERAGETVRGAIASAEEGRGMWCAHERRSSALAGFCGLVSRAGESDPEIMYGLAPPYWKQGLATEAAGCVLRYAFESLGAARVLAATDPPNAASVRVMERLGFRFVERGVLSGLDALFYELRRDDFRAPADTAPR